MQPEKLEFVPVDSQGKTKDRNGVSLIQGMLIHQSGASVETIRPTIPVRRKVLLRRRGYLHLPGAISREMLADLLRAARRLEDQYPFGFVHTGFYGVGAAMTRASAPKPEDVACTIIHPNAGFLEPDLLAPLADPGIHELIESVIGKDYYLSNTWMQRVPPGTPRMGYHKDPRGSLSFTLLLDDIGPGMGSTCMVPGSQLNTPPPSFCMACPEDPHPDEIELCGRAGDILFFSAEAWHARSANHGDRSTLRLFYNFYSRGSKATTSWAGEVPPELVERAKAALPEVRRRMLELDPALTTSLQSGQSPGRLRRGAESFQRMPADILHALRIYGKPSFHPRHPGYLLPHTTRFTEDRPFSLWKYLRHIKALPALKILIRDGILGNLRNVPGRIRRTAPQKKRT